MSGPFPLPLRHPCTLCVGGRRKGCGLLNSGHGKCKHTLYVHVFILEYMYRVDGSFRGIQFSEKGSMQKFHNVIFVDGRSE